MTTHSPKKTGVLSFLVKSVHFKKPLTRISFLSKCCHFLWNQRKLYWKWQHFERNEIRVTGFLKWTDFSTAWLWWKMRGKGQLISKCPYEKSVWTKIATKIFPRFLFLKFTTSRLLQNRVYLLANRT